MRTPSDLISSNLELVALPELVLKLNQMVDDPRCSTTDFANVILQDAALSAHLLQIANSPFYSLPSKIDSVSLAITIIGTQQLRDMILATTVVNHFNAIPHNLTSISNFWQHNIVCAITSSILAKKMGEKSHEQFFLAGLLHDIGKLVMYLAEPDLSLQMLEKVKSTDSNLQDIEKSIFGFNHWDVGAELLRTWKFPDSLVMPVLHHHSPADTENYQREAAAVHLGNAIANTIMPAISKDDDLPIDLMVWEYMGLDESMLDAIIDETRQNVDHILELLYKPQAA